MNLLQNFHVSIFLLVTMCELGLQTKPPTISPIVTPLTGQHYSENMRKYFILSPTSSSDKSSTKTGKTLSPLPSDDGLMFEISLDSKSKPMHRTDSMESTGASNLKRMDSLTSLDDFIQKALQEEKNSLEKYSEFSLRGYNSKNSPETIPRPKHHHHRKYSLDDLKKIIKKNQNQDVSPANNLNELYAKSQQIRPETFAMNSRHHRKSSLDNLLQLMETQELKNFTPASSSVKDKSPIDNRKKLSSFESSKDTTKNQLSKKVYKDNTPNQEHSKEIIITTTAHLRPPNPQFGNYLRNIFALKPSDPNLSPFHVPTTSLNFIKQENNDKSDQLNENRNDENAQKLATRTKPQKVIGALSFLRQAGALTSTKNQAEDNSHTKNYDPDKPHISENCSTSNSTNETIDLSKRKNGNKKQKKGSFDSSFSKTKIKEGSPDFEFSKSIKRENSPKKFPILEAGSSSTSPQDPKLSRDPSPIISRSISPDSEFSKSIKRGNSPKKFPFLEAGSSSTSPQDPKLSRDSSPIISEVTTKDKFSPRTSSNQSKFPSNIKLLPKTSTETSSTNKKLSETSASTSSSPKITYDTTSSESKLSNTSSLIMKSSHESKISRDSSSKTSSTSQVTSYKRISESSTDTLSSKTSLSGPSETSSPKIIRDTTSPESKSTNISSLIIKSSPKSSHESKISRDLTTKALGSSKMTTKTGHHEKVTDTISSMATSHTSSPRILHDALPFEGKLTKESSEGKLTKASSEEKLTRTSSSNIKSSPKSSHESKISRDLSTKATSSSKITTKIGHHEKVTDKIPSMATSSATSHTSSPRISCDALSSEEKSNRTSPKNIKSSPNSSEELKPSNVNAKLDGSSHLKKPLNKSPLKATEDILAFNFEGKKKKKRVPRTNKPDETVSKDRLKVRPNSKSTSTLPGHKKIRHPTVISLRRI